MSAPAAAGNPSDSRTHAFLLIVLAFLFFLRVLGQVLVVLFAPPFLPPMNEWYSALLPYPVLLPVQVVILAVQGWMCADVWRRRGFFARKRPRAGSVLKVLAVIYAVAMVARYAITMAAFPERRWLGGCIPIAFHFVLAGYLFTYGDYLARTRGAPAERRDV